MNAPGPGPPEGGPRQLADLHEAIETVYYARRCSLKAGDATAVGAAEQALHQLLHELYSRLGYIPPEDSPNPPRAD